MRRATLIATLVPWILLPVHVRAQGEAPSDCRPAAESHLEIERLEREHDGFGAAAALRMVSRALGMRPPRACEVVERLHGLPQGACASACLRCARGSAIPPECVTAAWPEPSAVGLRGTLRSEPPSWDDLRRELSRGRGCAARPVITVRRFAGGGGEVLVLDGFDELQGERWLRVEDPRETCGFPRLLALRHEALVGSPAIGRAHWASVVGLERGEAAPPLAWPAPRESAAPALDAVPGSAGKAPSEARRVAASVLPDLCSLMDCERVFPPRRGSAGDLMERTPPRATTLGWPIPLFEVPLDALSPDGELRAASAGWLFPAVGSEGDAGGSRRTFSPADPLEARAGVRVVQDGGTWMAVELWSGDWAARIERARWGAARRSRAVRPRDLVLVSVPALDRHFLASGMGDGLQLAEIGFEPGEPSSSGMRDARDVLAELAAAARDHDRLPR